MITEVVPSDFRREEAGWASTPGIARAMRIMDDAETAHAARQRDRSLEAETRSALEAVGRTLVEAIAAGDLDERTLPDDVRRVLPRERTLMEDGQA
jgi:hypothetical protein